MRKQKTRILESSLKNSNGKYKHGSNRMGSAVHMLIAYICIFFQVFYNIKNPTETNTDVNSTKKVMRSTFEHEND